MNDAKHLLETLNGLSLGILKHMLFGLREKRGLKPSENHVLGLLHIFEGEFELALPRLLEAFEKLQTGTTWAHLLALVGRGLGETGRSLQLLANADGFSLEARAVDELRAFLARNAQPGGDGRSGDPVELRHSAFSLSLLGAIHSGETTTLGKLVNEDFDPSETSCDALAACSEMLRRNGFATEGARLALGSLLKIPLHPGSLQELGLCFQLLGAFCEAAGCFRALCRVSPDSSRAHEHWGAALVQTGDIAGAIVALEKALQLDPTNGSAWRHLSVAHLKCGNHEEAEHASRQCLELNQKEAVAFSQYLFALSHMSPEMQRPAPGLYRRFSDQFEQPSNTVVNPPGRVHDRIRIGYISADLRNHPVASFIEPIFANHDTTAFEVFVYYTGLQQDETTARLRTRVQNWRDVWKLNDAQLAEALRQDEIDVLVDLSGHTPSNRLVVFARRAAPLQVTMIGCMQTTGLRNMDFRVSDGFLDPAGGGTFGTEALMRLDAGAFVFQPPAVAGPVTPLPFRSGAPFTLGCLNTAAKATDDTLRTWAAILQALPESRFVYVFNPGSRIRRVLEGLGVSPGRIEERECRPLADFLNIYAEVDLCLDPFPYNGLTTTLMGCWMGVPALCLLGTAPTARAAANIHQRMGLDSFIAHSTAEYVTHAVRIFEAPAALAEVRAGLRPRTQAAWCNGPQFTREFEARLRAALAAKHRPNPCANV